MKILNRRFHRSSALRLGAAAVAFGLCVTAAVAGPMDTEKLYTVPEQTLSLDPRLAPLMDAAMRRPDELTVIQALAAVRRLHIAADAPRVLELLDDPRPMIRLSAARTAAELDLKDAAPVMLRWASISTASADAHQLDQASLADDLLARWKQSGAKAAWTGRLRDPAAPVRAQIAAVHGLAAIGATDTAPLLSQIVTDPAARPDLRLAAADALATLAKSGTDVMPAAKKLTAKPRGLDPLLAARLLATAQSPEALDLLVTLVRQSEPVVQHAAMVPLLGADPARLRPLAATLAASADPTVRLDAVRSAADWHADESVALLLGRLDDPHPDVRHAASAELRTLANDAALHNLVRDGARKIIARAGAEADHRHPAHWREAERAAKLLGELDDKASADALVALFPYERLEVQVATVGALRSLDVPSTHPAMVKLLGDLIHRIGSRVARATKHKKHVDDERETAAVFNELRPVSELGDEVAQTLGAWRERSAEPLLRGIVPKKSPESPQFRAAAIWALGRFHEGHPDESLAKQLIGRVFDLNPVNPEAEEVRLASVIALGRMKAASQVKALTNRYNQDGTDIRCAARWAVHQITGHWLDPVTLSPAVETDAFLRPMENPAP